MFTLLLIYSHFFLINPLITARMIPPTFLIANSHSIQSTHTTSSLNYDGYHVSTLYYISMIMDTMDPHSVPLIYYGYHVSTLFTPSMITTPMYPHYVPLIYDDSHGSLQYAPLIDDGYHGSALFPAKLVCLPWLPPIFPPSMMMTPS